jgi:hypothetical protein
MVHLDAYQIIWKTIVKTIVDNPQVDYKALHLYVSISSYMEYNGFLAFTIEKTDEKRAMRHRCVAYQPIFDSLSILCDMKSYFRNDNHPL